MTTRSDQLGQVVVPLATAGVTLGGSIVSVADPTIEDLLDKFQSVIKEKLDGAWNKAASQLSSTACKAVYPYEPMPMLARLSWRWPALFMWRVSEQLVGHSLVYRQANSTGHLMYVLPPMPYDRAVKLEPIRVAVRTALDMYIHERGDPEVASGANPMQANTLKSFGFDSVEYTYLQGPEVGQAHPALDMTWTMSERQHHVDANHGTLTRIDTVISVMPEESTVSGSGLDLITTYYPSGATCCAFSSGFSGGFE